MPFADYFSIAIVSSIWIASFPAFRRGGRFSLWGFIFAIIGIIGILSYFTHAQFIVWQANEVSKYLIPPYHSLSYFLFYAWMRLWAPYVISLIAALLGCAATGFLNKRFGGRFFKNEELYFIATGLFVSGHPGWIMYIVLVLAVYFLLSLSRFLFFRETAQRTSFYYYWLPLAACVIIAHMFFLRYEWYGNLII